MFTPIWGRFPFWLIFFRWVETTNQIWIRNILDSNDENIHLKTMVPWFFQVFTIPMSAEISTNNICFKVPDMEFGPLEIEWFSLKVWKMYFHDQAFRLAVFLQAEETRGSKTIKHNTRIKPFIDIQDIQESIFIWEPLLWKRVNFFWTRPFFGFHLGVVTNWGGNLFFFYTGNRLGLLLSFQCIPNP